MRAVTGSDCFDKWCEATIPATVLDLVDGWRKHIAAHIAAHGDDASRLAAHIAAHGDDASRLAAHGEDASRLAAHIAAHGEDASRLAALVRGDFIPIQYEEGGLQTDECRSREYCSVLIHRDLYDCLFEMCDTDESYEYIFSDAENEMQGGDHLKRKKIIVTIDTPSRYYVYAYARWPISTMFKLPHAFADTLLNNYIHFQIYTRGCGESRNVLVFLQCFLDSIA